MQADRLSPLIGNRYRIQQQLGRGGMGAVYRAEDRLTGEVVALKRVTAPTHTLQFASRISTDSGASGSTNLRMALAQEFRILASLRHPNIIRVLDYGFDAERQPYLTMDLLDSPRTVVEAGRGQPLEAKINLLVQTLQALAYLHRRGVIHRDLKPDNVAVVREGGADRVRVLDFGLAQMPENFHADDATYDVAGTLAYMSPEVLQGDEATEVSDLYAVGVMAFEMLTGAHPFPAKTPAEMISKVVNMPLDITPLLDALPPPDVDEIIIVLSDDQHIPTLPEIIDRLLAKHPLDRYRSADAVIADLCAAVAMPVPEESDAIRESFLQAARFVGRESELRQLRAALESAVGGAGSLWLIGGESGVGKSRLMQELRTRAQISGVLTLTGQGVASGSLPYQLWRDPVRRLILSTEITPEEAGVLAPLVPDIDGLVDGVIPFEGRDSQQRIAQLIIDLLRRQSEPILLALEDLQWAHESLDVLRQLAPFAAELPLMVCGSFRDDERPALPGELPQARLISLNRLTTEEIARLTAAMLGEAGRRGDVVDFLQRETEGNAFFLVEAVRALAEEAGSLSSIGHETLPQRLIAGGIQQVIGRRLNRVPQWAHDLLNLAAVVGRELDLRLLAQAAGGIDLDEWLTTCVNRAVFEAHDGGWRFAHDKLREMLLDWLTPEQQMDYHRRAAEAIEAVYPADLAHYAAALAQHWHFAGDLLKEGHYTILAGVQAEDACTYEDACSLFARALDLRAYESQADPVSACAELHWRLGNTYYRTAAYDSARAHQREALSLFQSIGDRKGIANAITGLGEADMRQGLFESATHYFEQAQVIREELGLTVDIGYGYMNLGVIQANSGNWAGARELFRLCLEKMEQAGSQRDIARALNNYANVLDVMGDKDEARALHQRALEIREREHDLHGVCYSLGNLAALERDLGNYVEARPLAEKALALAQRVADRNAAGANLGTLGDISLLQGDYRSARGYFQQSLDLRVAIEDRGGMISATRDLGNVARAEGGYDEALDHYRQGLGMAVEFGHGWEIWPTLHEIGRLLISEDRSRVALKLLAFVRAHRDPPDHRDQDLINGLETRMTPNGFASAVALGEALTLDEVRAKVDAGTLDF